MTTTRRRLLVGLFAGTTVLGAGCVGSSDSGDDPTATPTNDGGESTTTIAPTTAMTATDATTTTPTGTPETNTPVESTRPAEPADTTDDVPVREPLACDEDVHRLSYPIDEIRYGSLGGFTLTASEGTVARGTTATFRLENTTNSEKFTGNKRKYDIQRRTDDGWRSIYWVPERYGYNDIGIMHPPGTGFTWEFSFAQDGLEQSTQFNTPYSVCESIVPGEYRFVYWGVLSEAERESDFETESAISVRFTVERPRTATAESG